MLEIIRMHNREMYGNDNHRLRRKDRYNNIRRTLERTRRCSLITAKEMPSEEGEYNGTDVFCKRIEDYKETCNNRD